MYPLHIYLSRYAYYVKFDQEYYDSQKRKLFVEKWIEDTNGKMLFNYLSFENLSDTKNSGFPKIITKIGISRIPIVTPNPFNISRQLGMNILIPTSIKIKSSNYFSFLFNENPKIPFGSSPSEDKNIRSITKITFSIDDSRCNLEEDIEFSDGTDATNNYHLISRWPDLRSTEYQSLFNLE